MLAFVQRPKVSTLEVQQRMQKSVTECFALPFASQVVMLILHNPATKETLVQTAQVRSRVAENPN